MQPLVIYHGNCIDGFTAAWTVHSSADKWQYAEYFAAHYSSGKHVDLPDVTGREVVMVDFCVPKTQLLQIHEKAESFIVLDHHKTAQADCEGLDFCLFDMDRSGAGLAWDHFHEARRPWLVELVEDRDLWRFDNKYTKPVHAYLASQEMTFERWDEISKLSVDEAITLGIGAESYLNAYVNKMRGEWQFYQVAGYTVPVVNCPYVGVSELLHAVVEDNPECPFAMSWWQSSRSHSFTYSLRSKGEFDVSAIAKLFGGGGHKNAAGFVCEHPPWNLPVVSAKAFSLKLLSTLDDTSKEFKVRVAEVRREIELEAGVWDEEKPF